MDGALGATRRYSPPKEKDFRFPLDGTHAIADHNIAIMFSIFHMQKKANRRRIRVYSRQTGRSSEFGGHWLSGKVLLYLGITIVCFCFLQSLLRVYLFGGRILWKTVPGPRVKHIEVNAGETITAMHLLDSLKIEENAPLFGQSRSLFSCLFSSDIRKMQRSLLRQYPTLASATITRRMPDTVIISVTERAPVARIASKRSLAIDRNGILFVHRRGVEGLPIVRGTHFAVEQGQKFSKSQMADAVLELLDFLASNESKISIFDLEIIDMTKHDYLQCVFSDHRRAEMAWEEMGKGTRRGRAYLGKQVNGLACSMKSPRAKGHSNFDATIPGHCFAK